MDFSKRDSNINQILYQIKWGAKMTTRIVKAQHNNSYHLEPRISFHDRFSTESYPWHRWVFDHYDFSDDARVLELGLRARKIVARKLHHTGRENNRLPPEGREEHPGTKGYS